LDLSYTRLLISDSEAGYREFTTKTGFKIIYGKVKYIWALQKCLLLIILIKKLGLRKVENKNNTACTIQ
jgi:hypothetical protein